MSKHLHRDDWGGALQVHEVDVPPEQCAERMPGFE